MGWPARVERTVIEGVEFDEDAGLVVARVRPRRGARQRCGRCGPKSRWYDPARAGAGGGRWIWARCRRCWRPTRRGCVAPSMGWWRCRGRGTALAIPGSSMIRSRVGGGMLEERGDGADDRLVHRRRDRHPGRRGRDGRGQPVRPAAPHRVYEISYKKGHRYLTVVADHDSRRLIWAAPCRDKPTLRRFFDLVGAEGCAQTTYVSADPADWIAEVVAEV
jgi:transposase